MSKDKILIPLSQESFSNVPVNKYIELIKMSMLDNVYLIVMTTSILLCVLLGINIQVLKKFKLNNRITNNYILISILFNSIIALLFVSTLTVLLTYIDYKSGKIGYGQYKDKFVVEKVQYNEIQDISGEIDKTYYLNIRKRDKNDTIEFITTKLNNVNVGDEIIVENKKFVYDKYHSRYIRPMSIGWDIDSGEANIRKSYSTENK